VVVGAAVDVEVGTVLVDVVGTEVVVEVGTVLVVDDEEVGTVLDDKVESVVELVVVWTVVVEKKHGSVKHCMVVVWFSNGSVPRWESTKGSKGCSLSGCTTRSAKNRADRRCCSFQHNDTPKIQRSSGIQT
jgi:hypothetical protein